MNVDQLLVRNLSGISFNFCIAFVFPDGVFGMSEDEAMFSEDEGGEGLSPGQDHQSQLPTPAAEKLSCLNRLAGH